jgi:acyl carrier protein
MENVAEVVLGVIRGVVREKSPETETIRPDQMLVEDLGLKSLDLARIVAKLEMKLGVDPFPDLVAITSIRTAGALSAAYARCFATSDGAEPDQPTRTAPRDSAGLNAQKELRKKARKD